MFTSKQTSLIDKPASGATSVVKNAFVEKASKQAARTFSPNGAEKFSSTGDDFVDQFGKMSTFKAQRTYADISKDKSTLWAKNPLLTIAFTLFLRTITRTVSLFDGRKTATTQRGGGLRHEGILRMMWLNINHRESFWKNIPLFISVGSWKDVITMLSYDLQYNGWKGRTLDWDNFGKLLLAGLQNPNTSELIKKYLPQIKANSKCTTLESQADNLIAKWLCSLLFGGKGEDTNYQNYKKYRQLKSKGTAHQWQQLISQGKHNLIDFNSVHGRALSLLVGGKYLANNGLEAKYEEWIASKPVAKFTGFVHELFAPIGTGWGIMNNKLKKYQLDTINSQFKGLIETGKKGIVPGTQMIVVRDTSSSMTDTAAGTTMSSYCVGKALALYFSELLPEGAFANTWIEFNNRAQLHHWKGTTPTEKFLNDRSESYGNTNFMFVITLFVRMKEEGVDENQFPTGILCISDGAFNSSELGKTNVEFALSKLSRAGFSKEYVDNFKIVLWNIPNGFYGGKVNVQFETYGGVPNVYYLAGYDGSIVAFLTGVEGQTTQPKNAKELFEAAMNQEVLSYIEV